MNVKPVLDRIMIKQDPAQDKLGSFALADTARVRPRRGTVVAVGTTTTMTRIGDKVVYAEYTGHEVEEEGEEYVILKEGELLYIL